METDWKVEGNRSETKIKAGCPLCHSAVTMHGDPQKVIREKFRHGGCNGLIESIPENIRVEYLQKALVSGF